MPKFLLIFPFLIFCEIISGQKVQHIHVDSIDCNDVKSLKLSDPKILTALKGAEDYIRGIAGETTLKHIWLNYCECQESGYPLFTKSIKQPKRLGDDTCYEFAYFVKDKIDTIGYFGVLVDKYGKPMKNNYSRGYFNQIELIRGFKKHFDKQFRVSYAKAVELGQKKGFDTKPVLMCESDNHFLTDKNNHVFVKVKYYWSFQKMWSGGEAYLDINAETGFIEKEISIPPMVK